MWEVKQLAQGLSPSVWQNLSSTLHFQTFLAVFCDDVPSEPQRERGWENHCHERNQEDNLETILKHDWVRRPLIRYCKTFYIHKRETINQKTPSKNAVQRRLMGCKCSACSSLTISGWFGSWPLFFELALTLDNLDDLLAACKTHAWDFQGKRTGFACLWMTALTLGTKKMFC